MGTTAGTYMHAAGHVYEGVWDNDQRHGKVRGCHPHCWWRLYGLSPSPQYHHGHRWQGKYVSRDGDVTEGRWVRDQLHK